jgi:hypothetical protein
MKMQTSGWLVIYLESLSIILMLFCGLLRVFFYIYICSLHFLCLFNDGFSISKDYLGGRNLKYYCK